MFLDLKVRRRGIWKWKLALLLAAAFPLTTALGQSLNVTLLGKSFTVGEGPEKKVVNRLGVTTLIQSGKERLLFDCSDGLREHIERLNIAPQELNTCFFTRFDFEGFLPLLFLTGDRKVPLQFWGPPGTKKTLSEGLRRKDWQLTIQIWKTTTGANLNTKIQDVSKGVAYQSGDLRVTAFTLNPGQANLVLAYRIDFAGHSMVLTGNTQYLDQLVQFSQRADVVVHEVMDSDRSAPDQAATLFRQVNPKLALFTSVAPESAADLIALTRKAYSGPLEVGEDLMTIEIGEHVEFRRPLPKP